MFDVAGAAGIGGEAVYVEVLHDFLVRLTALPYLKDLLDVCVCVVSLVPAIKMEVCVRVCMHVFCVCIHVFEME